MADLPPFADAVAALEALCDACSDFDPMHRLSLIGLYSRADGISRADLDSSHWDKDGARVAKPYAAAALLSEQSSLVTAALRMAADIPDLQAVSERTTRSMARGYLPVVPVGTAATPRRGAAHRALDCLIELLGIDPYQEAAEHTAMIGHFARAGGATAADFTGPNAIGLVAFTSTPTELTDAALRMAADHPDLDGYRRPKLHKAAADYLPA